MVKGWGSQAFISRYVIISDFVGGIWVRVTLKGHDLPVLHVMTQDLF